MKKKKKSKKQKMIILAVKAARQKSREEEINLFGKPINYQKVIKSKKVYDRKKNKRHDNEF